MERIDISRSRFSRRAFLKAAAAAGGSALLAACSPAAPPNPTSSVAGATPPASAPSPATPAANTTGTGTIRTAIGIDPDTLDPIGQTTTTVQNMVDYVCEGLVSLGEDGKPHPALAESWQTSPDGLTYTFKLRQGVTFHDGAPLNSDAVKLTWDRILNKNNKVPLRSPMEVVESVTPVDASTVQFKLSHPLPFFITALVQTTYAIVSPNVAKAHPSDYDEEPVGTGPYKFQSRAKGSQVVFVRNDNYWGKKPYFQTAQFLIVPEAATRESLLLAGQAEMTILPPMSDISKLQANNQVKVLLAPGDRTIFMSINTSRPGPFKDPKFRQALNYAVDKEGIIKSILFGAADPMDAPMASSLFGYCQAGSYSYDPNKAKQMLQAGGWSGTSIKMVYPTGRYLQDAAAAQAIAGNLRDVGLNVDASTMDWPSYLATVNVAPDKSSVDMHMLGWAPGYLDAAQQMVQFEKRDWPPAGLATSYYDNPQTDALLLQAEQNTNEQDRANQYCQASKMIWNDAPWIFLWVQKFPIVYSAKIKGVGSKPIEEWSAIYAEPA